MEHHQSTSDRMLRKRSRDDPADCEPISKRLNSLNLSCTHPPPACVGMCQLSPPVGGGMQQWPAAPHMAPDGSCNTWPGTAHQQQLQQSMSAPRVAAGSRGHPGSLATVPEEAGNPYFGHSDRDSAYFGSSESLGDYEPELGQRANPHYFNANRLLYHMHKARLSRHGFI